MRIAYVTAGAAGMYCGSCLHDNTLAAAMQREGHDVALIPTYTPIRTDEVDVSIDRVFYGAISVYLEQKSTVFRHTPRLVDGLLNRPGLIQWLARRGSSTDARELGALTLSMLRGEHGHQAKELDRLVDWLGATYRPDLVHLTNSMFVGTAHRIKAALGVPVVCSVQGEDLFLDQLVEPHAAEVSRELRRRAADVDLFIATSEFYVGVMADHLGIPSDEIRVVRLGIKLDGHGRRPGPHDGRPFTVAYLARLCPEKGLHVLVEAFRELTARCGRTARLRIAGYLDPKDQAYFDEVLGHVQEWGLGDVVEVVGEVDRAAKIAFLNAADVLSVPTVYRDPKGLFVLEALANGVPVVQPRHGAFPEMVEATGGGVLVEPGCPEALAEALHGLMQEPERRIELGRRGQQAVHREWGDAGMAEKTLKLYRTCLDNGAAGRAS